MRTTQSWNGFALLLGLALTPGCGAHGGSASASAERVSLYKTLSAQVKDNPASAITPLNKLAKDEADNAMPHYLLAAADASLGKWPEVLQEVETGNGAKTCAYPVGEAAPYHNFLGLVAMRQLVKAASSASLDFDTHKRLIVALRDMGGRIATGEPRNLGVTLFGASFRRQASHALADVLQRNGRADEANQARNVEVADDQWRQAIKQVSDQTYKTGGTLDADRLLQKYGFTPEDAKAYDTGQTPSPSARDKMLKMSAEMDQTERTLTEKLLQDMPR